jgi:hypothetical protein
MLADNPDTLAMMVKQLREGNGFKTIISFLMKQTATLDTRLDASPSFNTTIPTADNRNALSAYGRNRYFYTVRLTKDERPQQLGLITVTPTLFYIFDNI